jgi:hypothetical protein
MVFFLRVCVRRGLVRGVCFRWVCVRGGAFRKMFGFEGLFSSVFFECFVSSVLFSSVLFERFFRGYFCRWVCVRRMFCFVLRLGPRGALTLGGPGGPLFHYVSVSLFCCVLDSFGLIQVWVFGLCFGLALPGKPKKQTNNRNISGYVPAVLRDKTVENNRFEQHRQQNNTLRTEPPRHKPPRTTRSKNKPANKTRSKRTSSNHPLENNLSQMICLQLETCLSHVFFDGEVPSRACSEVLACCTGIAHCQ